MTCARLAATVATLGTVDNCPIRSLHHKQARHDTHRRPESQTRPDLVDMGRELRF